MNGLSAVPDPELEIRRGPRSSRPLDKGTGGGGGVPKTFFGPSGLSLAKNKGGGGPGPTGLCPGSATGKGLFK